MTMSTLEYELTGLPELEVEYEDEGEWEGEFEGDLESEEFFRQLTALARRGIPSTALRRLARHARTAALIGRVANLAMNPLSMPTLPPEPPPIVNVRRSDRRGEMAQYPPREFEDEFEGEFEGEFEDEYEWEAPGSGQQVQTQALMEHLGHAATRAENEAEAEAFIGALIPLAARLIPRIAPAVMRAAPQLIRGAANVTRTLRRNPATRPLVRALPTIVRRTTANLAQQVAQGRPVTPQTAVRTLARQTQRTLSSPQQCVQAYRRSRAMDARYHRSAAATRR